MLRNKLRMPLLTAIFNIALEIIANTLRQYSVVIVLTFEKWETRFRRLAGT